jgi:hypothetical protein
MANVDKPMGLKPVSHLLGIPWSGGCHTYYIPSTDNNAFAIGDPVKSAGSADSNGVASVTLGTAGSPRRGAIVGFGRYEHLMADPNSLDTNIIPATKTHDYYAMVADDPFIIFETQEIGTGTAFTATEVGLNADLVAGTNNGFISGWLLNNVGEATTATLNVRLLGLVRRSDNAFGAYAKWLVMINAHELKVGSDGL